MTRRVFVKELYLKLTRLRHYTSIEIRDSLEYETNKDLYAWMHCCCPSEAFWHNESGSGSEHELWVGNNLSVPIFESAVTLACDSGPSARYIWTHIRQSTVQLEEGFDGVVNFDFRGFSQLNGFSSLSRPGCNLLPTESPTLESIL